MEDLREIGKKVCESINKQKPSKIGDIVFNMKLIIESLRSGNTNKQSQDQLDHLTGLFNELIYNKPYELGGKIRDELHNKFTNYFVIPDKVATNGTSSRGNSTSFKNYASTWTIKPNQ